MKKKKTRWEIIRYYFNQVHLWLGLVGGIIIFVVCLTGTIYTFSDDIQKALQPSLYKVQDTGDGVLINEELLIKKVVEESKGKLATISIPDDKKGLYSVSVRLKGERRPITYQINPYNGEIMGIAGKGKGSEFFSFMFKAHRWLTMEQGTGRIIVGIATIMFAFGCITGIVIWFPKKVKHWKQGLKIKWGKWKRTNHDLHNSLGLYSFIFLLIMALTGLCWSFEWYKDGLSNVLGYKVFSGSEKTALIIEAKEDKISVSELSNISNQLFTYQGVTRINFPKEANEPISIQKSHTGFFAPSYSDKIEVNPYDGTILHHDKFGEKPFGEKIALLIKPLHIGNLYGTFTKIIWCLCCLIATSLPVTGVLIFFNKMKKKPKKKKIHQVHETAEQTV